jgi:hypothetical protein
MNTHKPTKHDAAQCELSCSRDELIGPGTSSNAPHTVMRYSQRRHMAESGFRHVNRQHLERQSDAHRNSS